MHSSPVRARGGVYRLRHADGTYVECMLTANPHTIDGERFLQVALVASPARVAAFGALEITMRGGSLHEALERMTEVLRRTMPESFGVVFEDPGTRRTHLAGDLDPVLAGVRPNGGRDRRPTTPWQRAIDAGTTVILDDLDDMPDDIRSAATAQGWDGVSVIPLEGPLGDEPTLFVTWVPVAAMAPVIASNIEAAMAPVVKLLIERQHHIGTLEVAATHDWLTGLGNRARFLPFLGTAIRDQGAAVLYLDLDGYKPVNDRMGHDVGDAVLVEIAARLQRAIPEGALVARLGGDEFAVALPRVTLADAVEIADHLVEVVRRPIRLTGGEEVAIGVSIGVALADPRIDVDEAVAAADQALLAAKQAGRGCVRVAR